MGRGDAEGISLGWLRSGGCFAFASMERDFLGVIDRAAGKGGGDVVVVEDSRTELAGQC